jgi:hypothetical protein
VIIFRNYLPNQHVLAIILRIQNISPELFLFQSRKLVFSFGCWTTDSLQTENSDNAQGKSPFEWGISHRAASTFPRGSSIRLCSFDPWSSTRLISEICVCWISYRRKNYSSSATNFLGHLWIRPTLFLFRKLGCCMLWLRREWPKPHWSFLR